MTKKEFREKCSFHTYGKGGGRSNAIFYDWQNGNGYKWLGFKFMVKSNVRNIRKQDLFDILYDWVNDNIHPPYYVTYKYAETDEERFKVPLIG
jgi:hypothetical protein